MGSIRLHNVENPGSLFKNATDANVIKRIASNHFITLLVKAEGYR